MTSKEEHPEDPHSQKKCLICDKGFHFRKKIICDKCENSFCADHCCKEISTVEGLKIICDSCYHEFRKMKLQEKFSQEIEGLNSELGRVRQACKRVERDYFDKTSEINSYEIENQKQVSELEKQIKKHEKELSDLSVKLESSQKHSEYLSEEQKVSKASLESSEEVFQESENKLEELRNNLLHINNVKADISDQLIDLRGKVEHCLDYEKVAKELCLKCAETMKKCYQERVNTESNKGLDESSMSLYTSQSILESVREMKESLNILVVEPEKQPKCLVV